MGLALETMLSRLRSIVAEALSAAGNVSGLGLAGVLGVLAHVGGHFLH
jgi:hypothetical protein